MAELTRGASGRDRGHGSSHKTIVGRSASCPAITCAARTSVAGYAISYNSINTNRICLMDAAAQKCRSPAAELIERIATIVLVRMWAHRLADPTSRAADRDRGQGSSRDTTVGRSCVLHYHFYRGPESHREKSKIYQFYFRKWNLWRGCRCRKASPCRQGNL